MSREPRKKKGDMARARAKHLRRQEIQDAISAAKAAGPDDAPVRLRLHQHATLGWCEWDLTPLPAEWAAPAIYLVRLSGSRLEVCYVTDKDGVKACTHGGTFYVHGARELLARAEPVNSAAMAWV